MRGSQLAIVRYKLRAHLGVTMKMGLAMADDELHNRLLSSKQQWLAAEWQWPFLRDRWNMQVNPGDRFLNLPTQTITGNSYKIDVDRDVSLEVRYANNWQDVDYGIGAAEYNTLDPDLNDRMDPVEKWQYNGANGFEIWPLPASVQTIRFTGYKTPNDLIVDTDVCELDDELVALFVAAELLAKAEQQDAGAKAAAAQTLLLNLRGAAPTRQPGIPLGHRRNSGSYNDNRRRTVPIAVAKQP